MFTGIVQGTGRVTMVEHREGALTFELMLGELANGVERGASIAIAGVCLTVTSTNEEGVRFDVIGETLAKTALGSMRVGSEYNVERSAKLGDEIGGHQVSGHVSGVVTIRTIEKPVNNWIVCLACDPVWTPYLFPKGFVTLDGCSLTIVDVGDRWFTVHLIPETLARTTFGQKGQGDPVHLEIDPLTRAIVDTVKRFMLTV